MWEWWGEKVRETEGRLGGGGRYQWFLAGTGVVDFYQGIGFIDWRLSILISY